MSNTPPALSGLARRLVSDGLLAQELAQQAQAQAMRERVPFVQHLVTAQVLDARTIAHAAADEFGTPLFDLDSLVTEHIPTQLEIGRASCRERVEIWGGGGSVKRNKVCSG